MNLKYGLIKSYCLFTAMLCLTPLRPAHAQTISGVTLSQSPVTFETGGVPNGTTISFTMDEPGLVQIAVNCGIVNAGDTGTNVANLSKNASASDSIFWNGLWLIGGDYGRQSTSQLGTVCNFTLTLSTNGASSTPFTSPTVTLNSVDIHNVLVTPSVSATGAATFPYTINYSLAKLANVTVTIINSSSTTVRTLLKNQQQVSEAQVSTMTLTWDGLADSGSPVPLGLYTLTINATDPVVSGSSAIPRTRTISVQSLAGAAGDPQQLFENNVYVYPNPVRNGQAFFNAVPVRDGATIHLRIYTITGTLVLDQDITNQLPYPWHATNQSGNKVGRGLYYYVMREDDSQGTLQVTKKMAVLP